MLAGLFLDFDGVVVESASIKTRAFTDLYPNASLEQLRAIRRHHLENTGISRYQKFEWIEENVFGATLSAYRSRQLGEHFSQLVLDAIVAAPLVPGVLELLKEAQQRVPVYLISGTPQSELELIVNRMKLSHYFTEMFGSPAKKADTVFYILAKNSLEPQSTCFIGDGPTDYDAARETGVRFIARDSGEHKVYWRRLGLHTVDDFSRVNLNNILNEGVLLS